MEERAAGLAETIIRSLGLERSERGAGELAWALYTAPFLARPWESAIYIRASDARVTLRSPLGIELKRRGYPDVAKLLAETPGDAMCIVTWLGAETPRVSTIQVEGLRIAPRSPRGGNGRSIEGKIP